MIIDKKITNMFAGREYVFEHLKKLNNESLKVIDLGGAASNWCHEYVTHIADIFLSNENLNDEFSNLELFNVDFESEKSIEPILDYVEVNGKFDFSICTHTLEDLNYPQLLCKILPKISKAGFISVPSKYTEYARFENHNILKNYRGFHHHRWIYQIKDNKFIGYPKTVIWEHINLPEFENKGIPWTEIGFIWEDNFDFEFICPSFLLDNKQGDKHPLIIDITEKDDLVL